MLCIGYKQCDILVVGQCDVCEISRWLRSLRTSDRGQENWNQSEARLNMLYTRWKQASSSRSRKLILEAYFYKKKKQKSCKLGIPSLKICFLGLLLMLYLLGFSHKSENSNTYFNWENLIYKISYTTVGLLNNKRSMSLGKNFH